MFFVLVISLVEISRFVNHLCCAKRVFFGILDWHFKTYVMNSAELRYEISLEKLAPGLSIFQNFVGFFFPCRENRGLVETKAHVKGSSGTSSWKTLCAIFQCTQLTIQQGWLLFGWLADFRICHLLHVFALKSTHLNSDGLGLLDFPSASLGKTLWANLDFSVWTNKVSEIGRFGLNLAWSNVSLAQPSWVLNFPSL